VAIHIVRTLPQEDWRRFVEEHPQGNIFHTPEMFQVFAQTERHDPTLWAAVNDSSEVLALLLPVRITLMNPGVLCYLTARSVVYGSVLYAPGREAQEALAFLLHTYIGEAGKSSLFTELRNLSDLSHIQPVLCDCHFIREDHLNFLIDLRRSAEEIWRSLQHDVRTNVRKARKMEVVVEEAKSLHAVQAGYALLKEAYERIQVPLAPPALFEAAFNILYPQDMIRFFLARVGDTYIGVAIRLFYRGVIYAWYAGATRDYSSYKAHDLLNWHVLEWGAQNGFRCFDFGGAGKPDEDYGPRKFKAKFGGDLVNYGRNICIHHPHLFRFGQWGYQLYRHFL
jgi:serine/alanine adding enzyme